MLIIILENGVEQTEPIQPQVKSSRDGALLVWSPRQASPQGGA